MKSLLMTEKQRMYYGQLARGDANIHFSQFGEDIIIATLLRKHPPGFYADIGAHAAFRLSNTAMLYHEHGWRGINVDLDERAIRELDAERPRDINLCCAVGAEEGEAEALVFDRGAFNTLDAARQKRFGAQMPDAERRRVRVRTLPSILAEHMPPDATLDFLNVDVEGLDHAVLASNDWTRYRPKVIAVETHGMNLANPSANPVFALLTDQGYRFQSHVWVTSIFVL